MRYFGGIIIGVLCSINGFCQVLFSENFSSLNLQSYTSGTTVSLYTTAPTAFSLINDGYGNNVGQLNNLNKPFHVPALKTSGWVVAYSPNVNDTFLVSTSWFDDNTLTADRWILTPTVNVGANTVLTWLAMSPDAAYPDGYEVYGTNKPGTLTSQDFTIGDRLFQLPFGVGTGEKNTWTRRSIPLGMFAGQNLRFAFRNNSKDMYQLWIDDIEIKTAFYSREVQMSSITTEKYFLTDTAQTVGVSVTSNGATTINTLVLNYQYGTSPVNSQTFVIPNGLSYLQSTDLSFALKYSISSPGYYTVKSWISSVDGSPDQNLGTDTIRTYVTVQSSSPLKNILVEQFVSAYNGESPDAQDKAWSLQTGNVVQVNIHDADSLKEANSVGILGDYKKDFATALIDRVYYNDLLSAPVNRSFYTPKVSSRSKAITPASVSIINKTYNPNTKQLSFAVKADFVGEVKGDYRINAYLIENNVCGKASDSTVNGYNQLSNYFSIPWSAYYQIGYFSVPQNAWVMDAWRFKHHNVLVHSFDGSYGNAGLIPSNGGTQNQSYQKTFTLTIPTSTNGAYVYNADNIYVVGFVAEYNADKTKRNVLNVVKEKLNTNSEVAGIKENRNNSRVKIYPNPSNGTVYLESTDESKNYQLKVYDISGKCIWQKIMVNVGLKEKVDLSGLSNGVYVLEISSNTGTFREKLVIQGN